MKKYLFIVPLTPNSHLNKIRQELQELCLSALKKQTYSNWSALLIGSNVSEGVKEDKRFIHVDFEGIKAEKLQVATEFIKKNNIISDYIIRLDDDDIFNNNILSKIKDLDFDIYVDKTQFFWNYETKQVASRTWYWFPNTCIHKTEHALAMYGDFVLGEYKHFHKRPLLIENDHSVIHRYYIDKKVIFSNVNDPIYVRSITDNSITANNSLNKDEYLFSFGNWKRNNIRNFDSLGSSKKDVKVLIFRKILNYKNELISKLLYTKYTNLG